MNAPLPGSLVRDANLDDKYDLLDGWAFMSGTQALVRLAFQQRLRDVAAGLNTAGFISGYRGSPLGRYDLELWRNAERLKSHHIHFQPGVNEDLAATAVWGSQHVGVFPGAKYDGVFSFWYGKTPGVDRSADALRHANAAGTSSHGGVLALCGDDHGAKSSTQAGQSDYILMATGIPILYPANVQDILDYGLHGIAMSRFAGCWVGLKLVTDVVESSSSVALDLNAPAVQLPHYETPADGLAIRAADPPLNQEARLYQHKLQAALAYARSNSLNQIVLDAAKPRLGIITAGKSYSDTRQALRNLQLDGAPAEASISLLKLGMVWPLDPDIVARFAANLDTILVVEEKRPVLENQLKTILFDALPGKAIRVVGKFDGGSEWSLGAEASAALSSVGELSPNDIATVIARLLGSGCTVTGSADTALLARSVARHTNESSNSQLQAAPMRMPSFCSGCPHNTSTKVPDGSRALAGIGCHGIAMSQQPGVTGTISHMGGEGVMWVGQAPFTNEKHVFANLGDGTYFHSGILAIRQAVAAKVPITYKLLVNGFVSMTGGQPIDGDLSVPQIATELLAEGVGRVIVVADDPSRYDGVSLPAGVRVEHRRELEAIQRELREYLLVSVLIYDQMCATERRRLRKRGKYDDPAKRTLINLAVCEGCGDCSAKSNCMSVEPVETELGRKRRINQASCNKDFSCVEGFCPSFVTVHGGDLRRGNADSKRAADDFPELPEPVLPSLDATNQPYGILVTGIGGTGVVTVGAVLAMAAHLDGKAVSTLDVTGLAQKYGAVMSHIRVGNHASQLQSARLAAGEADLLVGCDLVVSAGDEAASRLAIRRTQAVVNTQLTPTSDFLRNPDWQLNTADLVEKLRNIVADDSRFSAVAATRLATDLLGDAIAANTLMLGFAWQRGWVPVSRQAIERAIELNGVSVQLNLDGFLWGRRLAHDEPAVTRLLQPAQVLQFIPTKLHTLADVVKDRSQRLKAYQNQAYAKRYARLVERVATAEADSGNDELARVVARNYYKLLAHKDEFEVARLYAAPEFRAQLKSTFEGDYKLHFHVGGGPFAKRDPVTGTPRKRELGPWMMPAFRVLAGLRGLRGSVLDPFRNSDERKLAAQLLDTYESDIERIIAQVQPESLALAIEIANWPEYIRGYGHVRQASADTLASKRQVWWQRWEEGRPADTARQVA